MDRVASFWGAVINTVPGAHTAIHTVTRWFGKSSSDTPPVDRGFGIDPNGIVLNAPAPPVSTQN